MLCTLCVKRNDLVAQSNEWIKKPTGMKTSKSDVPLGRTDELLLNERNRTARRTNSFGKVSDLSPQGHGRGHNTPLGHSVKQNQIISSESQSRGQIRPQMQNVPPRGQPNVRGQMPPQNQNIRGQIPTQGQNVKEQIPAQGQNSSMHANPKGQDQSQTANARGQMPSQNQNIRGQNQPQVQTVRDQFQPQGQNSSIQSNPRGQVPSQMSNSRTQNLPTGGQGRLLSDFFDHIL
jgi:hypothetical protein